MFAKKFRISLALSAAALAAAAACPQAVAARTAQEEFDQIVVDIPFVQDNADRATAALRECNTTPGCNAEKLKEAADEAQGKLTTLITQRATLKKTATDTAMAVHGCGETGTGTCVRVTENIPGGNCTPVLVDRNAPVYVCPVGKGFSGFMGVVSGLLKYLVVIGVMVGVLMIVVSGIRLSLGSAFGDDGKAAAKEALMKAVGGVATVILLGAILNTVAPWVFK